MKTQEYLNEIRKNPGLRNAILTKITVDERRNSAEFYLVTDRAYSDEDEREALAITKRYLPDHTNAKIKISKLVADADLIRDRILGILKQKFPAAASFVSGRDVAVEKTENGANFFIEIGAQEQGLFRTGNILDVVAKELSRIFCGSFIGNVRTVEREESPFVPNNSLPLPEFEVPIRIFEVCGYQEIDGGEKPKYATYIADVVGKNDDLTLCGEITDMRERELASGRVMFTFHINDKTGLMRVGYFAKKRTIDKVRELKAGDTVVFRGDYSEFNGNLSYTARTVNRGSYPENFVPEQKQGKGVPAAYKVVRPEPFSDYNQSGFFDAQDIPAALKKREYVVYDIETTGLNNTGVGGRFDRIIELGAVKIRGGEIVEKFSTFVAPEGRLSAEITKLTGITDEMLEGAPPVSDVIADFYKFTDGCALVGHNSVGFDFKFINYYGKQNDYYFTNEMFDTLFMSQKFLRLSNHKLNTVADYYGVTFNHHRAFDDALATAKIFIGMLKDGCELM